MPYYSFEVHAHYLTDPIWAETEEKAREIADKELQYSGEEWDTDFELYNFEEDD